jgi:BolA family transcriptional regulator, general stress-responsive regulator
VRLCGPEFINIALSVVINTAIDYSNINGNSNIMKDKNMTVKENIELKLNNAIKSELLEVIDESHKHAGHMGARPEGETHFHVNITAKEFNGQSLVARQRTIYKILADDLAGPVHALSLSVKGTDD